MNDKLNKRTKRLRDIGLTYDFNLNSFIYKEAEQYGINVHNTDIICESDCDFDKMCITILKIITKHKEAQNDS